MDEEFIMVETVEGLPLVLVDKERYKELLEKENWLNALEGAGIDNWDCINLAKDIFEEYK